VTDHPISKRDRRLDIWIALAGILGLILCLSLYRQAFPSAAIHFPLSRQEIAQRAEQYLREFGYDPEGYKLALTFGQDYFGSIYLQRTLGIPETNRRLERENLPIYYWTARWFKPLQKEEFSITLAPDGQLIGYDHKIMEDAPGADLVQANAEAIVQEYLATYPIWQEGVWEVVKFSSEVRPAGRKDHTFTWKRQGFSAGKSELRLSVSVQGDQIGSIGYWLKIPEDFSRDFSTQSNRAGFITGVSLLLAMLFFNVAAVAALSLALFWGVRFTRRVLIPVAMAGGISLLSYLNYIPLAAAFYSTTEDYSLFWINMVVGAFLSMLSTCAVVLILWTGGQSLGKIVWPNEDRILPRGPDSWVTLSQSAWRGLALAGIDAGYVVIFYLIATRVFGGWTPMEVGYTNLYATPFPFLGALEVGLLPAINEELLYRLIGIGLFLWLARKKWLALLIPGLLWGFAHASYIRDPIYLRGIELTISALIMGAFFMKYGLMTTIMAHMAFNAGLTALPMLRSSDPYFVFCGIFVIIILLSPVLPGLAITAWRRVKKIPPTITPLIAPATVTDLDQLKSLPVERLDWHTRLGDPAAATVCLKSGAQIIGTATGSVQGEGLATVQSVFVAPEWRRQYWGTRMVEALSAQLKEKGAQKVEVQVPVKDRQPLSFWASQGWRATTQVLTEKPLPTFNNIMAEWRAKHEERLSRRKQRATKVN